MIVFPSCKINLGLFVTGKRPDGFHSLESIFLPVPWCDVLEVIPSEDSECFFQTTGISIPGNNSDNILLKAWRLLQAKYAISCVKIHLHKVIPMGAGLGGGSSDGAFMLKVLNDIFQLKLNVSDLEQLAAQLGSDCPFFIRNQPSFVSGRGEILNPLEAPIFSGWLAIVDPGVHVSTARAFSLITPKPANFELHTIHTLSKEMWSNGLTNDFEVAVCNVFPEISQCKQQLLDAGACYSSMSGSGSAVFGLFEDEPKIPGAFMTWVNW